METNTSTATIADNLPKKTQRAGEQIKFGGMQCDFIKEGPPLWGIQWGCKKKKVPRGPTDKEVEKPHRI